MPPKIKFKSIYNMKELKVLNDAYMLYENKQYKEAEDICRNVFKHYPNQPDILNLLGVICLSSGKDEEGLMYLKRVVDLQPHRYSFHGNLGIAYKNIGMFHEAIVSYKRAVQLNPNYALGYNNIGSAYQGMGMIGDAIENYQHALSLDDNLFDVHLNLAMAQLLIQDFENGWDRWEYRLATIKLAELTKPAWYGQPLNSKTILVYAEMGYGDTFQFIRYLPALSEVCNAEKVLFQVNGYGLDFLKNCDNLKAEIVNPDVPANALAFDENIHLMSLPRIFSTNLSNMPYRMQPYLQADPYKVKAYEKIIAGYNTSQIRIGIFWQGSPELKADRNRSMPLHYFYPICRMPEIQIYSFQKGYGIEQLSSLPVGIKIINLGETFTDWGDTAAALQCMDLVICVDTAIGHLSGALGKPTWVLLPSHPEWRWCLDMDYSPWYRAHRLFRHPVYGNPHWEAVMQEVIKRLKKEVMCLKET